MRIYKDLAYIQEHLQEIIDETTIGELEMNPDYEDTTYWFFVKTENGKRYKIRSCLYIKWPNYWRIVEDCQNTSEE